MEGAFLIGLEIAAFFAGIYWIEFKRYKSSKNFEAKDARSKQGIVITHDNVDKIPTVFAIELRKMLDHSKDGAVLLGNAELLEVIRSYIPADSDGKPEHGKSNYGAANDGTMDGSKSADGRRKDGLNGEN